MATKKAAKKAPAKKRSSAKKASGRRKSTKFDSFICNVVPSKGTENDWQLIDSIQAGTIGAPAALPASVDLRGAWWTINNQEKTGSCGGGAHADGVAPW